MCQGFFWVHASLFSLLLTFFSLWQKPLAALVNQTHGWFTGNSRVQSFIWLFSSGLSSTSFGSPVVDSLYYVAWLRVDTLSKMKILLYPYCLAKDSWGYLCPKHWLRRWWWWRRLLCARSGRAMTWHNRGGERRKGGNGGRKVWRKERKKEKRRGKEYFFVRSSWVRWKREKWDRAAVRLVKEESRELYSTSTSTEPFVRDAFLFFFCNVITWGESTKTTTYLDVGVRPKELNNKKGNWGQGIQDNADFVTENYSLGIL